MTVERRLNISAVICACIDDTRLHSAIASLLAQTRTPDEIIVVNTATVELTRPMPDRVPGVLVIDEPHPDMVQARARGFRAATGDVLLYIDAHRRAPVRLVETVERRFARPSRRVAATGPYRFYQPDWLGVTGARLYGCTLAPLAQLLADHVLRSGGVLFGGSFAVRRTALEAVERFDPSTPASSRSIAR